MKKFSRIATLGLLAFVASPMAHADGGLIVCTSTVLTAASPIVMHLDGARPVGTIAELKLHEGQVTELPTHSRAVREFAFDTGIVHLPSGVDLSDRRIHGVLQVNLNDPARSMMKSQVLSRVCEGLRLGNHCSGSWEVLESDVAPVSSEMTCSIR